MSFYYIFFLFVNVFLNCAFFFLCIKKRQQTALHIGVEAGYQDIVEILLGANASLDLREKVTIYSGF